MLVFAEIIFVIRSIRISLSLIVFFEKLELKYNTDLKIIRHFIRCRIYEKKLVRFLLVASYV